jgi:hypothetical protein
MAALTGDVEIMKELLKSAPNTKLPLLSMAVIGNKMDMIRYLVEECNWNIEQRGPKGNES